MRRAPASSSRVSTFGALALLTGCSLVRDFDALTRDNDSNSSDGGRDPDGATVACPAGACPPAVAGVPQEIANEHAPVTSLTRGACGVIWGSPATASVRGVVAAGGPVTTVLEMPGRAPGHVACNADTVFATDAVANRIVSGSGTKLRELTWSAPTHIAAPSNVIFYESGSNKLLSLDASTFAAELKATAPNVELLLASDKDIFFFSTDATQVQRSGWNGAAKDPIATGTVRAIALDASRFYYATSGGRVAGVSLGLVVGAPVDFGIDEGLVTALAVSADYVYWTTTKPNELRRAPLQGGAATTAVPKLCTTVAMAADKGYVFLGCDDGRVLRVVER